MNFADLLFVDFRAFGTIFCMFKSLVQKQLTITKHHSTCFVLGTRDRTDSVSEASVIAHLPRNDHYKFHVCFFAKTIAWETNDL